MSINFKEVVLNNYGGFKLKADVDENPEDIIAAVCYFDHGDHFLVIKTKDACYKYGLFVTRNGYDARCLDDENHYDRSRFIKMPKLTGPFDHRSPMTNKIFFLIEDYLFTTGFGWNKRNEVVVCRNEKEAQFKFNYVYDDIKECYETKTVYHCDNDRYYLGRIMEFLEANDILTEENLKKVEDLKVFLRLDTIDGTAGKQKAWDSVVIGDDLDWIWYKGEKVTKKYHKHGIKVKSTEWDEDDWGPCRGFYVDLDQFV